MKPSVCRTVHFVGGGGECEAAIVTAVRDDHTVDLAVFPPHPLPGFPCYAVCESVFDDDDLPAERAPASWHWPEMVPREPGDRPQ